MLFGTVVDIDDPKKTGRVKVKVYHLHDNIATNDLGWSMCLMPANTPAQSGLGASVNLQVGTLVGCQPLDIAQQEFLVVGTLPTKTDIITDDTDIEDGEAVTISTPDNNIRVRGEPNPHESEPLGTYEPGSCYEPVYPYNNVMETESGHIKEYDDTPGAERIMERHKSGTQYEIQPNGSKVERIVSDNYQLVCGHDTVEVHGNVRIIVSGHCDLAVAKDLNAKVGGNMSSTITGNLTADITGATNITSAGDMTLKVPTLVEAVTLPGEWGPSGKKIILNGNVDVTHTLRTNTDSAVTIQSDAINVNTHTHQHDVQVVPSTSYSEVPEPEE